MKSNFFSRIFGKRVTPSTAASEEPVTVAEPVPPPEETVSPASDSDIASRDLDVPLVPPTERTPPNTEEKYDPLFETLREIKLCEEQRKKEKEGKIHD